MDTILSFLKDGLLDASLLQMLIYTLVFTHITIATVTIFLHRHQAHRSLDLHPAVSHFFRFWLWLGTGMETKAWAAIHRKHHAKCETEEDPHSPKIEGIKTLLLEGTELYRKEAANAETLKRYGHGTPDDWLERNIYTPHSALGLIILLIVEFIAFGALGLVIWTVQALWIPIFAAGVINGIGHYVGYRNFDCLDASTNISPWGILIGGEELHNNHHSFPTSPKLSMRKYEFDIGWLYIRILTFFGLAKPRKVPQMEFESKQDPKSGIEALLSQRYQVLRKYSQIIYAEWRKERVTLLKSKRFTAKKLKAIKLFFSNNTFDRPENKKDMSSVFAENQKMKFLDDMRDEFMMLWSQKMSREDLQNHLVEWCKKAESSKVEKLKDFSFSLRKHYGFDVVA